MKLSSPSENEKPLAPHGLTLVITTYNGSDLITETLTRLYEMEKVPDLDWEVLVVDNNSTDDTLIKVASFSDKLPTLRVVHEPNQGAGYAVLKGILESKFELIGIIDQDNWVKPDWMLKAVSHIQAAPHAAIICGHGFPLYAETPPPWFDRYPQNFAVGSQSKTNGRAQNENTYFYNAGAIMRRAPVIALIELGFQPLLTSRAKHRVLAGDDTELQVLFKILTWEIHYQDDLQFDHYMPKRRLEHRYFKDLRKGLGESAIYINLYRDYLHSRKLNEMPPTQNWFKLLFRSFLQVFRDPIAIPASWFPKFATNFRVVQHWSRVGEFTERLSIGPAYANIRQDLYTWLDSIVREMKRED